MNIIRHLMEVLERGISANTHHLKCRSRRTRTCDCWIAEAQRAIATARKHLAARAKDREADGGPDEEDGGAVPVELPLRYTLVPVITQRRGGDGVDWGATAITLLKAAPGKLGKLVWRKGHTTSHRGDRTYYPAELQMRDLDRNGRPGLLGFDYKNSAPRPDARSVMTEPVLAEFLPLVFKALGYDPADPPVTAAEVMQAYRNKQTIILK